MDTRLTIDWTACEGRGWCVELLPEILTRDPWGYPVTREQAARAVAAAHGVVTGTGPTREIVVPERHAEHARRAARACPRLALRLRAVS
jgi:ferredoxin